VSHNIIIYNSLEHRGKITLVANLT